VCPKCGHRVAEIIRNCSLCKPLNFGQNEVCLWAPSLGQPFENEIEDDKGKDYFEKRLIEEIDKNEGKQEKMRNLKVSSQRSGETLGRAVINEARVLMKRDRQRGPYSDAKRRGHRWIDFYASNLWINFSEALLAVSIGS